MIIAATSESELRQRIVNAVNELSDRLEALGEGEDLKFLREAGVKVRTAKGDASTRTITLPVSLGASAR
jgi:hypothetical protein